LLVLRSQEVAELTREVNLSFEKDRSFKIVTIALLDS
jgi:hypothetical protein